MTLAAAVDVIVTITPWNPWPVAIPLVVLVVAVVVSIVGTRRRSKPIRELGYVLFIVSALTAGGMAWVLSGIWDTRAREQALEELGYISPTFSGGMGVSERGLAPIDFTAELDDGTRVNGVLVDQGGGRWLVKVDD
ncbi:hypothetical protein ASE14_12525 [Agromyces sp. Root81]|uniref:hypothetical protein n=1 Tax=Agromyces sp. Root81 TaxID=1736601 RepID=UPI0006FAB19B|nr:hypothetical protein [Agromyces sp. Root81]KRC61656.1 hypothetical protein ASE14_12525 [Agromyces sp. Root81]